MMRKALVLVAALATLALAAGSWISYGPNTVSALPKNLENGAPAVLPPGGTDLPNVDTVKYDDNTPANAWASMLAGNGFGTKFIKPYNPITLQGAMLYLWANTWPTPGGNNFKVKVVAANGVDGAPGESLWMSNVIVGTRGAWNYVPIGIPIIDYEFYIFYVQADTYPSCPGMAIDARNNAPDGFQWDLMGGGYTPAAELGDWCIRAVFDWTPSTHNVAAMVFGNLPRDTVPNINLNVQATFRNFGTATEAPGIDVKMHIEGPQGYTRDYLNDSTVGTMAYRGQQIVTYRPTWHIPDTAGEYTLKVWHELPTDEYRGNDTMVKTINVARWCTYADWSTPSYVTWAAPDRAVLFHPADFSINYPLEVSRVKAQFYWHSNHPWDDSLFSFALIGEDGSTILWQGAQQQASHMATISEAVDPPVSITSGDFYLATIMHGINGNPSTLSDATPQGRSFNGSTGGGWVPYTTGELFHAVSARFSGTGVEENKSAYGRTAISLTASPNPSLSPLVSWQVGRAGPVSVDLYDAAGRHVRSLFSTNQALSGSFRVDTRELGSGLYILKLQSAGKSASTKLVVN
jgi:hypothetical protein